MAKKLQFESVYECQIQQLFISMSQDVCMRCDVHAWMCVGASVQVSEQSILGPKKFSWALSVKTSIQ